jgi:glucokinase
MSAAPYWIGIDLGGTKILTGLFDSNFKILGRSKLPTDASQGGRAVFDRIIETVDTVISESKLDPALIAGLALAVPGQIVPGTRVVRYAPNLDWRDLDLNTLIPASWKWPVFIENDVRMGTYGEWCMGAAKGAKHVFGVFVGTGVGGGLILDGKLYNGFNGNAGEVGHIVMNWRKGTSLEGIAGRRSITNRAKQMLDDSPKRVRKEWKGVDLAAIKSSHLADYYQKDDPVAVQLIDDGARALGAAIGSIINLLSPEVIVLGGGLAGALGESFRERLWEIALRYTLPRAAENVRCVAASLADDSGIYGAAAFARDSASKDKAAK